MDESHRLVIPFWWRKPSSHFYLLCIFGCWICSATPDGTTAIFTALPERASESGDGQRALTAFFSTPSNQDPHSCNSSTDDASPISATASGPRMLFYPDLAKLDPECDVLLDYQDWNFDYKFSRQYIEDLLCRCYELCSLPTVPFRVIKESSDMYLNPLSGYNIVRFIGVTTTFSLFFVVGVIGNVIVIYGLGRWIKVKTPTFLFIMSLAFTDLLLLFVCMPLKIAEVFVITHVFGAFFCKFSYYIRDFTFVCWILTMTVISFERYYAICHPLKVQYKCTKRRARILIFIIWGSAAALAVPTIVAMKSYKSLFDQLGIWTCQQNFTEDFHLQLYFSYYLGILFVLPLLLMSYNYGRSSLALWRSARTLRTLRGTTNQRNVSSEKWQNKGRIKVVVMLIVILFTFLLCWGPSLVIQVLQMYKVRIPRWKTVRLVVDSITFLNSCINPYIFISMSTQFQVAAASIRSAFKRRPYCCRRSETMWGSRSDEYREKSGNTSLACSVTSVYTTSTEYN